MFVYLWNESWGGDGLLAFPGYINNDGHDDLNVYHLAEQKVYSRTKEGELLLWAEPYNIPAIFVSENPSYVNINLEIAYLNTDTQEIGFLEIS